MFEEKKNSRYTRDEKLSMIGARPFWYHKIDLGDGVVTPGMNFDTLWNLIRSVKADVNYEGKRVLDIGSWDGLWCFEAEQRGARSVVATDISAVALENFLICHKILESKVTPYFNVSPYRLADRLDAPLQDVWQSPENTGKFDIIQNFGVLYHLRDPMLALSQARSVIDPEGVMIVETAVYTKSDEPVMIFNGNGSGAYNFYNDMSSWWAPTITCLRQMLEASLFRIEGELAFDNPDQKVARCCFVARPVAPADAVPGLVAELNRSYRNPGLDVSAEIVAR